MIDCGDSFTCQTIVDEFPTLWSGFLVTLKLVGACIVPSVALAVLTAMGRMSERRWVRGLASAYVELFRSLPALILLVLIYFGMGALLARFGISAFWAAVIALSLNEGAYTAEPYRSAILSVGRGQWDAARSIGLQPGGVYRLVVLPQALLPAIAPTSNMLVFLVKGSALASLISVNELLLSAQFVVEQTYVIFPIYGVVAVFYLVLTVPLTYLTKAVESKVHRATGSRAVA
jgi:His/Glu/Gln/Arg/opine family amino acid ABC transporter permease subunit